MSYTKKEALVQYGDWDSKSDGHPAAKWMREYTGLIDKNDFDALWNDGSYVSQDFKYSKSTGEQFPPGKASFDAVKATYAFFTEFHHEPYYFTAYELDDNSGYALSGNAWVYYSLPGGSGDKPLKDATGKQWEFRVPGGFYFEYKKDQSGHDGLKITSTGITSDSGPIVVQMLQRGIMSPKDLGL